MGDTRIAGGSGGYGYATWEDDAYSNTAEINSLTIEGGAMLSKELEVGIQANVAIGVGEGANGESFSLLLDPGVYGRLYFGELGTGPTPYIHVDIMALNAVRTGAYDNEFLYGPQDKEYTARLNAGLSVFMADNLALELEVLLAGYQDKVYDFTDLDAFQFTVGLSFYF
jgi:hypothetical protein